MPPEAAAAGPSGTAGVPLRRRAAGSAPGAGDRCLGGGAARQQPLRRVRVELPAPAAAHHRRLSLVQHRGQLELVQRLHHCCSAAPAAPLAAAMRMLEATAPRHVLAPRARAHDPPAAMPHLALAACQACSSITHLLQLLDSRLGGCIRLHVLARTGWEDCQPERLPARQRWAHHQPHLWCRALRCCCTAAAPQAPAAPATPRECAAGVGWGGVETCRCSTNDAALA